MNHCFVIGRQRSGTTVFRKLLASLPYSWDIGEIFHTGPYPLPEKYFKFRQAKILQDIRFSHPVYDELVFLEFIEAIKKKYPNTRLIFDIKYIDLHYVLNRKKPMANEIFLESYFEKESYWCFHLNRRNKLRLLISEKVAQQTGLWEAKGNSAESIVPMAINAAELLTETEREVEYTKYVRRRFEHLPTYREFEYEGMFDSEGNFSESLISHLEYTLDFKGFDHKPELKKQGAYFLRDVISNFEKLEHVFLNSEHAWMLD